MARKSRKAQAQEPVAETKKEVSVLSTAIYARLSVENSGKDDDGNSLQNQIDVCRDYLDGCPYLQLTEVYSDNGRTGTVFDRPAWNRLMDDVRTGKIQCIVVRDLSRFGRDYVETGNYLEKIFPALGTRFISVKENFDSSTGGSIESLSVSLQNMVNAIYSRDISKKVSTALRAQMETGAFRNRNLPYGYLWNEDKTAYVVDEEAAAVVRQIFEWKMQGVSVYQMIDQLKAGGIESPERHKRKAGTRTGDNIQGEGWCPSTIRGIMQNRAYVGEMIYGKSKTALYKGLKKRLTEKDNWVVVSNAHPPIIPLEDFEVVERQMREDSSHRETAMERSADIRAAMVDLLDGKIFCADCGKRMYYKRQRICGCKKTTFRGVYDCSTHVRRGHDTCSSHLIRQDVLNEKVFHAIRDQLQVALDYERLLSACRGGAGEANIREKYNAAVSSVRLKLNALKKKRAGLYESYAEGILNGEEYAFAKQTYEGQYETLGRLLDEAVERRERFLESISPENKWLTMMRGVAGETGLTQGLVDAVIEKVLVYGGGRIEVVFNYKDVFDTMCECVEQMKEAG